MEYDFVIIGSGPAGSTLAWSLAQKGNKIAIIDRAIHQKSNLINDFFCPYINKLPKYYTPVYSNQLGGNSALWHGKIYLISQKEFDEDKWGFRYDELTRFSDDLANELEIDSKNLTKVLNNNEKIFHYSYRSDLRNIFEYLNISKNDNIELFKGYSPIKLNIKDKKIDLVEIINSKNQRKKILVKNSIIFCAGGLGNPHLLMNLLPDKIESIGKFLSDHAHVNLCKIKHNQIKEYIDILKPNIKNNLKDFSFDKKEEAAQVFEYNNFFAGVQLDYKIDPLRRLRRYFLKVSNITIRRFLNFFGFFVLKFNGFLSKLGLLLNKYYKYSFEFYFSQHQNYKNFVELDKNKLDGYGLKKINIHWDLLSDDIDKIDYIINSSVGSDGKLLRSNNNLNFSKNFYNYGLAGLHPSCTTMIGDKEKGGVVNSDLKLHNYNNLYICGSSTFPQNGFTNPTWTIMTLAKRLSENF